MQRRSFLKRASLGAVAGAAVSSPAFAQDMPSISWRLSSGFPSALDLRVGAAESFCKFVAESTAGKFNIRHFPDGEVVAAADLMEAVSTKKVECGHVSSRRYHAKNPAFSFDAAVPFGLNARQMNAWMSEGEGLRLMRELFKPEKIINFPLGNTGAQMGGWYVKEIKREGDLKDLKMRVDGLAGEVLSRLGVAPQQVELAALAQAFEKEGLQAVAGAGAYEDAKLGLNKVAKYYYAPGWWAGGEQLSLYINDEAWNHLPKHYQSVVQSAALAAHTAATARYDALNPQALAQLTANGAQVRAFPRSIMDAAFEASQQVYKDLSAKDPRFKALHDSYMGFRDSEMPWFRLTEGAFGQYLGVALSGRS
ncbi:twin-arginine translocation signal domain-containing protein [Achromobacter mucicolens]|uniref:Twin-arginine translocation signal domain-containing protein n=1 Tax=Achromobacter mucicolens TaxID=1389922 RepID=A0ABD4YZF9_9BURK|nr:twin-arginine translocation signal domain-containing protein [Achromobacter mucicolens]MDH1180913.1 twin-arginine translocation signal domain-containing protein [Achromobacter mucicolens]